ncbi:hypothetical protein GW813_11845, partial [bacterium]|nr:hypothetical protein [bacterium]
MQASQKVHRLGLIALLLAIGAPTRSGAEDSAKRTWTADIDFEIKAHYRDSDENAFPVNFPFTPDQLPRG